MRRGLLRRDGPPPPLESASYWEHRYRSGGTSGPGSAGRLARFKADEVNRIVADHQVETVIELGCGDGGQLELASYPRYLGVDVSQAAINRCRERFANDASMAFHRLSDRDSWPYQRADLVLSLDVVFHLVEDEAYEAHMRELVALAERVIVVYSSNVDAPGRAPHVRHRRFTAWMEQHAPEWQLDKHVPNPFPAPVGGETDDTSFCDFWVFVR